MQHLATITQFPGFYNSWLDSMIDTEIESIFDIDGSGCKSAIPEEFYLAQVDYSSIREAQAKAYCEAWLERFNDATGLTLQACYESYESPKYYNFTTDRLFINIAPESINGLFEESAKDQHKHLKEQIEARFTSYDGFLSSYSNDLSDWLEKPVLEWDHNEIGALLDAVLTIHCSDQDCADPLRFLQRDFNTWDIMENFQCNGELSDAVWTAIPKTFREFAELQRNHERALDYEVWLETGQAWDPESGKPCPPLRCKHTIEMQF